jgi:hypothetical protein
VLFGYVSSWFLPIFGNSIGYEGAEVAIENLEKSVGFFTGVPSYSRAENIYEYY